ncbi:MAG: hypothetical protein PHR61_04205 [Candidatus Absconditabacteria bacterium]|nr:hypothetical protein [Candidatus Absconditabacteria bacterium]
MEKKFVRQERMRGFCFPKANDLPKGFQVFTPDEYFTRQKEQNALADVPLIPFPLMDGCKQGDIDKCQILCGACVSAGGFENIPKKVFKIN